MLWLKYNSEIGMYIQHAKNEGEYYCGNYSVDGINEKNKFIFEYNRCLYHGCIECYSEKTFNPFKQMCQGSVYAKKFKF